MNTCNCRECRAQRNYRYPKRRNFRNPRYYNFSGDTFLNEIFNELISEDEYNLKRYIPSAYFKKYKDNLRAQARRIARNRNSGVSNQLTGSNIHHRIPLQFAHLMKSQNAKYKMNKDLAHPNSPGNLVNASKQAHDFIHNRMNAIIRSKKFQDRLNDPATTDLEKKNLIRSVRDYVENQARKLNMKLRPIKSSGMAFQNKEGESW